MMRCQVCYKEAALCSFNSEQDFQFYLLLSDCPYFCCISLLYLDLYVLGDDAMII